jgi:hypothetical protein
LVDRLIELIGLVNSDAAIGDNQLNQSNQRNQFNSFDRPRTTDNQQLSTNNQQCSTSMP